MKSRRKLKTKTTSTKAPTQSKAEELYNVDERYLTTEKKCQILDQFAIVMTKTTNEAKKLRWSWVDTETEMLLAHPLVAEKAYRVARAVFIKWFEKKHAKKKKPAPKKKTAKKTTRG